jgi:hypothetical protein
MKTATDKGNTPFLIEDVDEISPDVKTLAKMAFGKRKSLREMSSSSKTPSEISYNAC